MNITEKIKKVETDENFQKLSKHIKENKEAFNIFRVLKLHNHEIRHSNFLVWLLNPKENHGLGNRFLNEFLNRSGLKNVEVETEVQTNEGRRIDILIKCDGFVCVIENKYGSDEHGDQCSDYKKFIDAKFQGKDRRFIFLDVNPPENPPEDYEIYTYRDNVLPILKKIVGDAVSFPLGKNSSQYHVIKQYKNILEEKYMKTDPEIVRLCKEIYREHKDAIRLISENGSGSADVGKLLCSFIENNDSLIEKDLKSLPKKLRFLPKIDNLGDKLRWGEDKDTYNGNIIALEFNMLADKVIFALCVQSAPKDYEKERNELIDFVEKRLNIKIRNKSWIAEDLIIFDDVDDIEEAQKCIEARLKEIGWIDKLGRALSEYLK